MKRKILILIPVVFIFFSCAYHKEDQLYGLNCDTSNVTYSTTIKGIINNYACLNCHSGPNPIGAGIHLETYDAVKAKVTDGRLFGAINHYPGFAPMPDGAGKMSQCDIDKVKAWIDAGAPNN